LEAVTSFGVGIMLSMLKQTGLSRADHTISADLTNGPMENHVVTEGGSQPYIRFLQTHLIWCAKEQHESLFEELILQGLYKNQPGSKHAVPVDNVGDIIHFKTDNDDDSEFSKRALTWAVENENLLMMLELLKLEHHCHNTEEEAHTCLQHVTSSNTNDFSSWIFEQSKNLTKNSLTVPSLVGKLLVTQLFTVQLLLLTKTSFL
jgi:hypothetical protein